MKFVGLKIFVCMLAIIFVSKSIYANEAVESLFSTKAFLNNTYGSQLVVQKNKQEIKYFCP